MTFSKWSEITGPEWNGIRSGEDEMRMYDTIMDTATNDKCEWGTSGLKLVDEYLPLCQAIWSYLRIYYSISLPLNILKRCAYLLSDSYVTHCSFLVVLSLCGSIFFIIVSVSSQNYSTCLILLLSVCFIPLLLCLYAELSGVYRSVYRPVACDIRESVGFA